MFSVNLESVRSIEGENHLNFYQFLQHLLFIPLTSQSASSELPVLKCLIDWFAEMRIIVYTEGGCVSIPIE